MPITEVKGPDGRLHQVEHPEGALESQIIKIAQSQAGPAPKKNTAVGNLLRAIPAGLAQSGYDTLNVLGQEVVGISAAKEKAKFAFDSWAGNARAEDTSIEDIEKRKRENQAAIQKYVGDTGDFAGEAFGVEEGRLGADIGRGLGQLPLMFITRGASAVPMAMTEVRKDAEETFATDYADMNEEQRDQVRLAQGLYSAFSVVANRIGLKSMGLNKLDDFFKAGQTVKGSVVKKVLKDSIKGSAGEFVTEAAEAAAQDQFARIYDPNRDYSWDDVKRYAYEGFVGGIVGGTVATGVSAAQTFSGGITGVPVEGEESGSSESTEGSAPLGNYRTVEVTYKQPDGTVRVVPISVNEGDNQQEVAEKELAGRYDPAYGVTVADIEPQVPNEVPDPIQEPVPVEPEAAVEPPVVEAEAPATEQAPEARSFRLPSRLSKTAQPKYQQSGKITFASDLERAAYSATTKGKSDPAKRRREQYRARLQNAGYSDQEIIAMGREVRSQMQGQYNKAGDELSVDLNKGQDVAAEAFSTYVPFRYTGKNPKETPPPFFKQFNPEGMTEGNFVDLKTGESLNNKTFEGGSVRVENDRPILETSEVEATPLNKRDRKQGRIVRTNLFRRSAGWNWTKEPENAPQTTLVSVEQSGKHYYTTNFVSNNPLTLDPRAQAKEPRGRPYTKGDLKFGNVIGEVVRQGVKAPVYDTVTVGEPDVVAEAAPSVTPSVSSVSNTQDPSRVGTARNPDGETSQDSNIEVSMVPEETLEKHMEIMDYGHLPADIKNEKDTKVKYEKLVNFMKDNLLSLYKAFPDELRARATQWYDGANKIANGFAKRYQITTEQASAVLAVLSPQKDWFMNVAQGEQVIHIWRNYQDVKIEGIEYDGMIEEIIDSAVAPVKQKKKKLVNETAEQTKRRQNYNKKLDKKAKDDRRFVLEQIKGKTVRELAQDPSKEGQALMAWAIRTNAQVQFGRNYSIVTPEGDFGGPSLRLDGQPANNGWGSTSEIVKAVSIIEDGSAQNISDRLGSEHKVRNFYNNIAAPNSPYGDATMDTHAVAAALLMPLGSSAQQVSDNFGSGKAGKTTKGGQTVSGTYYVYLDAYRRAAKEVGLQPRQMQSITWEAIRQVYLPQDRKPELVKKRTKEWNTYKDETEARQQIIGETINAPEWSGTSPSGRSGTSAAGVQGNGDGSILGGDLLFRGGSDIIGVPGNSTQITVPAGNRLRLYNGTVSYRGGKGKHSGRSEKTFTGILRVNAKDFVEIASRNKRNHKFGSSVDVYKEKDYKGYHLIVAKGKGKAYVTLAISPSGEVSSVTASKSATKADVDAAFDLAIASGAVRWLNGFDTVLGTVYARYGFEPVARLPFDPEQKPSDWSYQKYQQFNKGQPDLLFMKFNGQMNRKFSEYPNPGYASSYDQALELATEGNDVTAQAADTAVEDRGPRDTYDNGGQVQDAIEQEFDPIGKKINVRIVMRMKTDYVARYNATQGIIEYNPMLLLKRSKAGIRAAMREEIIHAAMHQVLMVSARKKFSMAEGGKVWTDFFGEFGKSLTDAERADIKDVYQNIKPEDYVGYGSEYSRAVIQNLLYGEFSEEYQMQSQGGPAWNTIVKLLRSVQAYMAKVLGPMIKTNPEAAQVIVDSVELLKAVDPSIRPKSQDVVAQAYDATDKNTAKENAEAGATAGKDSSERIAEQRKWFDNDYRKTASQYLTPIITRLNGIHPEFGRIVQGLDTAIRKRVFTYQKQTEQFFKKLNSIKGDEFVEVQRLIFFSPTPAEANLAKNREKMDRRDAILQKYGLLNMYRLDVQPILEQLFVDYSELGMPDMGYLQQYFPRSINDLKGLIESYGQTTKRTFESLVRDENIRRSELKDSDGNPAPLASMDKEERGRFFQDFLQNKLRKDLNGVKLPGNTKVREIDLIPPSKLKFYDAPGISFSKYVSNMSRAIESFKVVGDTRKGEGRLLGTLGKLSDDLFTSGQIDQADADLLKSLTELTTATMAQENILLRNAGTFTYLATLVNPGPVIVQFMDQWKVMLRRGPESMVRGLYRTVTGNRRFDLEKDFYFSQKQISAEFDNPGALNKILDTALTWFVPFRQMDTAMKHSSIESTFDDFVSKAKSPVGSKKYNQLLAELTITMGSRDALLAIADLHNNKANDSTLVKEALLAELLQRQPLTYLQVPEKYQTDPNKRLFYKLQTFMLLDVNFMRQQALNDLAGPGKTLEQRTNALRQLTYIGILLTAFGLPKDLLEDWITGKDTYLPDHVADNLLSIFGMNKYSADQLFREGPVKTIANRFTPAAWNIIVEGGESLHDWVSGDKELSELKFWSKSPLAQLWYYRFGAGAKSQKWKKKKKAQEGKYPTF